MIVIGLVTALALQADAPPGTAPISLEDELRRARNEYAYGNYQGAAAQLRALLYPMRLTTDAQVIEARKYLALSYYLLSHEDSAKEEFVKLLYLDPDYELDPFSVAPPVIESFEAIRRGLKEELDSIRQSKHRDATEQPKPGVLRVVTTRYVERSAVLTYMPFGIGQLQNGDMGWALFFGISEIAMLALNVGSYLGALSLRDYAAEDSGTVKALTVVQYSSLAAFGTLWSIGAVHAKMRFIPGVTMPAETHDQPIDSHAAAGLPAPLGLSLVGSF